MDCSHLHGLQPRTGRIARRNRLFAGHCDAKVDRCGLGWGWATFALRIAVLRRLLGDSTGSSLAHSAWLEGLAGAHADLVDRARSAVLHSELYFRRALSGFPDPGRFAACRGCAADAGVTALSNAVVFLAFSPIPSHRLAVNAWNSFVGNCTRYGIEHQRHANLSDLQGTRSISGQ